MQMNRTNNVQLKIAVFCLKAQKTNTLKEVDNNWGQIALIVENQPITILDESGDTVAVTGVSDSQKIAYMEDRAISPGMEVMSYD